MAIAVFPLVLAIIGALAFALSANAKVSEMGRIAFFCGLLALSMALSSPVVRLG